MKDQFELLVKKKVTQDEMNALKTQYGDLDQITIQGKEGTYIHDEIQKMKGWIEAINWALK